MVLNALAIDPLRPWKGPWRWFSEELLNCCVPLEEIAQTGITISEFVCLGECNGASCSVYYADSSDLSHFRSLLIRHSHHSNYGFLVVSYDRRGLSQTGSGHFSPIGSYNKANDMVLIMDVARFKYPPHWVSVETLFSAMLGVDKTTGRSRGYIVVNRSEDVDPCMFSMVKPKNRESYKKLVTFLSSTIPNIYKSYIRSENHNKTPQADKPCFTVLGFFATGIECIFENGEQLQEFSSLPEQLGMSNPGGDVCCSVAAKFAALQQEISSLSIFPSLLDCFERNGVRVVFDTSDYQPYSLPTTLSNTESITNNNAISHPTSSTCCSNKTAKDVSDASSSWSGNTKASGCCGSNRTTTSSTTNNLSDTSSRCSGTTKASGCCGSKNKTNEEERIKEKRGKGESSEKREREEIGQHSPYLIILVLFASYLFVYNQSNKCSGCKLEMEELPEEMNRREEIVREIKSLEKVISQLQLLCSSQCSPLCSCSPL